MTLIRQQVYALLLLFLFAVAFSADSLYDYTDPLYDLNSSTFNRTVLGKNTAWIIEFYNNWCGHCIRFAPVWKQFSREIKTWKKVIDIAVVNCNSPENVDLCRRYEVKSFPTIRLFWHHTNKNDLGEVYEGNRTISSLEDGIINFLDTNWNKGVPSDWPNLRPLSMNDLQQIRDTRPGGGNSVTAYVERTNTCTGRKVILDMSSTKYITIGVVLKPRSAVSFETGPALIRIGKNSVKKTLLKFSQEANETDIRNQVFQLLVGRRRITTKTEDFIPEKNKTNLVHVDAVFMTDLENALYSSLYQEVAVSNEIKGEKFSALKGYLSVLERYFPGSRPIMGYISKLHSWLSYRKQSVTGPELVQQMQALQGTDEHLPELREWVGCKGSSSLYRGYPCSLWTLFHTLTVQADLADNESGTRQDAGKVIFVMRDYITNFFTCEDCTRNFLDMATDLEEKVLSSQDAVFWLWEHHNQVNQRLSGDPTEDPGHPKIQFPSKRACPQCQTQGRNPGEIVWDRPAVLKFLHTFYSKRNIKLQDTASYQRNTSGSYYTNDLRSTMERYF